MLKKLKEHQRPRRVVQTQKVISNPIYDGHYRTIMNKIELENLLSEGYSVRAIGRKLLSSQSNVRYWMNKFGLRPNKWVKTTALSKEDIDKIKEVIASSRSYGEALIKLNYSSHGSRYNTLKKRVSELNLDVSHFLNRSEIQKIAGQRNRRSDDEVFCENSTIDRHTLKSRIKERGVIEYKCQKCGQDEMWNGERITLILDHINGVNNDNRKENLRFVCPNCESTLPTHCKGHKGLLPKPDVVRKIIDNHHPHVELRKIGRPTLAALLSEVDRNGYSAVGRKYGVSDNAIRKWIRCYQKYGV